MKFFDEPKLIWNYLGKYKKRMYRVGFLAIWGSVIAAAIPYLYGRLVDIAKIGDSSLLLIFGILVIWLLMTVISDWLARLTSTKGTFIGIDAANDLTCEAANHLISLPLDFHKDKKMGEVISRIQRAADLLERIIDDIIFFTVPQFLSVLAGIIILFYIQWSLGLGLLMVLIIYSLVSIWKTTPIIKNQKKLNEVYEKATGDLYDSILNIGIVKSSAAEDYERKKLDANFKERAAGAEKTTQLLWRSLQAWQSNIFSIGFVLLFGMAIVYLRAGIISVGELVMFVGYVSMAIKPFGWLGNQYRIFRQAITAIKRVKELLLEETEEYHGDNQITLKNPRGKVEFKDVSFGYLDRQIVLRNISLAAFPGEKVALIGGSGVGKTTLVDLISRYYPLTEGQILIDDQNILQISLQSLRSIIAIVPQEITLFNDTVMNNIRYVRFDASREEIIEAAKAANAHDFIEELPQGYDTIVGERGIKLSTGQKQRIAIARALLRDPKILILDEATSSLDSLSEKLVQEALEKLMEGRTTFIIAHRLSTVRKADKILVLEEGKIVERGTHQELIKTGGIYSKLYSLQFDLGVEVED